MIDDFSDLRRLTEGHMPSTLTITRLVYPLDENGQPARDRYGDPLSPTEEYTETKCRLKDLSGDEQIIAGRLSQAVSGTLVCPQGTALSSDMTVQIDGESYNVVFVRPGSEALQAHVQALVARA